LCNSSGDAVIGFFVRFVSRRSLRKASFTRRSSSEWKLMIANRPPGFTRSGIRRNANSRDSSSRLTAMRSAWNVRVAGSIRSAERGTHLRTSDARSAAVRMGLVLRSTILRAIRQRSRRIGR
jgi:hypothetical protein